MPTEDCPVPKPVVKRGPARSFGYMRRPEKDTAEAKCWEAPDGRLIFHRGTGELWFARVVPNWLTKIEE